MPPVAVLTSNRTRDVHDALKRRCLYHWVDQPDVEREVAIVRLRAPEVAGELARQVAAAVAEIRALGLYKPPGIAETIDWARALSLLGRATSTPAAPTPRSVGGEVPRGRSSGSATTASTPSCARRWPAVPDAAADPSAAARAGRRCRAGARRCERRGVRACPTGADGRLRPGPGRSSGATPSGAYWAGRATLIRRPEDVAAYDRAFGAVFGGLRVGRGPSPCRGRSRSSSTPTMPRPPSRAADDEDDDRPPADVRTVRWSATEVLRHRDLAACTPDELAEAHRLMADLRVRARPPPSRRRRPAPRRRGARSTCAAPSADRCAPAARCCDRATVEPGERPRRLVLLVDVSGSMEPYARALARFAHAAVAGRRRGQVEVFALGTRVTRITRELATHDPDAALRRAADAVADWSGGTRLGEGLRAVQRPLGRPGPGPGRGGGDPVRRVGPRRPRACSAPRWPGCARVAHRVVWVNPLKASPGYAPLAGGMAAALPHVDEFVEGHSVASLEALAEVRGDVTREELR